MRRHRRLGALLVTVVSLVACAEGGRAPRFVTTVPPAAYILREVVGDSAAVIALLPAGASPHAYEPRPSDVTAADEAVALFFVSSGLDAWAARLPARHRCELLALLPESRRLYFEEPGHSGDSLADGSTRRTTDPHFWTDPGTVAAILPALTDTLCALDAERCTSYRANAARFADTLRALDAELSATLAHLRGRSVVLFHPSFQYLFASHGIDIAAVIEPSPGKEPTARAIETLARTIQRTGTDVIFTEPQLPRRPAAVVAELAHVRLAELDPLGGVRGRDSYAALVRYNASVLARSIR